MDVSNRVFSGRHQRIHTSSLEPLNDITAGLSPVNINRPSEPDRTGYNWWGFGRQLAGFARVTFRSGMGLTDKSSTTCPAASSCLLAAHQPHTLYAPKRNRETVLIVIIPPSRFSILANEAEAQNTI